MDQPCCQRCPHWSPAHRPVRLSFFILYYYFSSLILYIQYTYHISYKLSLYSAQEAVHSAHFLHEDRRLLLSTIQIIPTKLLTLSTQQKLADLQHIYVIS